MLTYTMRARSSSLARSHSRIVETSTPITALTTKTADSQTRRAPSASGTKLGSPRAAPDARLPGRAARLDARALPLERAERGAERHAARLLVGLGVRQGG